MADGTNGSADRPAVRAPEIYAAGRQRNAERGPFRPLHEIEALTWFPDGLDFAMRSDERPFMCNLGSREMARGSMC